MVAKEKVLKTVGDNLKLILSYGDSTEILARGVFQFDSITPGENSKGDKISGDSKIIFTRLSNVDEKIVIPVKNWMNWVKNQKANMIINNMIFHPSKLEEIVRLSKLLNKNSDLGIEHYLDSMSSDILVKVNLFKNSLENLEAYYLMEDQMQGLNYSLMPVNYNDKWDNKEPVKTMND